jgi:hypothetical protein
MITVFVLGTLHSVGLLHACFSRRVSTAQPFESCLASLSSFICNGDPRDNMIETNDWWVKNNA